MTIPEIQAELALLEEQLRVLLNPHTMTATESEIYTQIKLHLGEHLTLNPVVPAEVGCAEAVSKILSLTGLVVPSEGIPSTAALYEWLVTNPKFVKIDAPEQGAILVSPTGFGNGSVEGHTGFFGSFGKNFANDWGICSNDSATGLFLETWSYERWKAYYGTVGNLPLYMFRAL